MKMEYKLIEVCRKGYVLTREPETVSDELYITFTGAPQNATAIFENGCGDSLYRLLKDDTCSIPAVFLKGRVKVTVVILNGNPKAPKYVCEGIYTVTVNGGVLVCPDGMDIENEIIAANSRCCDLNARLDKLAEGQDELKKQLDKITNGYDIT